MSKIDYSIITEIKKSDKGNVYLAKVKQYDFPVVVKELKHGNINVLRTLQKIENEHFPKIFQVEETEEGVVLVEEYIDGELLADYLSQQKLTESGSFNIAEQLCDAMKILHSQKPPLIHRDIKPSNLIVSSNGILKLIDFDSTRLYRKTSDSDTRLLGTQHYAPPEQYGFSQTDCRSDIYSFGVVLERLSGFISKGRKKQWKLLVEKCTLFDPDSRFQSVSEIETALKKMKKTNFFTVERVGILVCIILLLVVVGVMLTDFSNTSAEQDNMFEAWEDTASLGQGIIFQTSENLTVTEEKTDNTQQLEESEEIEENPQEEVVLDEKYRTIPPEFRDLESDIPAYVSLKEHIRENRMVVIYCFKDRMTERDFYVEVKELDYETTKFHGMKLYSEENGQGYMIEEEFVEVEDNVIIIAKEYMDSLESGYYTLATIMSYGEEEPFERGIYLYVASSDILEEPGMWLQNTTYDYHCGTTDNIHLVVRNDSSKEIASLQLMNGGEIDSSMYRVLQNGRVMEISSELLSSFRSGGSLNYNVVCKDGSSLTICINGVSGSN